MIGEYGLESLDLKRKLYLCKPNLKRTTIAILNESYSIQRKITRGGIGELTFKLPFTVFDKIKMKIVSNDHINKIKERFLIRFEQGEETEFYLIDRYEKNMDSSEYFTVYCYSLGYQLRDKIFTFDYSDDPKNITQYLVDILSDTNWSISYVEATLDLKYRSLNLDGSVLELIQQIAEKFSALVVWNTIYKQISFYEAEKFGMFKGMTVKQGKLMKDVQQEINLDEFCTRLKLYGKDGISIQEINPMGTDFLQDFSYFLYPFQMDANGKVLKSSSWFDDDVSIALVNYQKLIDNNFNTYSILLQQLNNLDLQLLQKQNELRTLQTEMIVLQDNLDTYNATHSDNATNPNTSLIDQISAKQTQINNKNVEISNLNSQITSKKTQISNLQNLMSMESNFTNQQLSVLSDFIIEKKLEDSNYTNVGDLYTDGKKQFDKMREPKIVVSLSIVNFYEILGEQHNVGKLSIGDIILVQHDILNINTKAYVTEMSFDYDAGNITITVSNAQELLTDRERFIKEHQNNLSSSNKVNMNEYKWDQAVATADDVSQILQNEWDATARAIAAGQNEDVSISRRGVIIKDPADPLKMLIMQHGQLALTSNGGNTWQTAINASGVFAERLVGRLILGNKLMISDDRGLFTIEGNLLTVKDTAGAVRVKLGEYATGKYGLQITSKKGIVLLSEDGIMQTNNISMADNVESGYPLKITFNIDDAMLSIQQVKINFTLERFRAYSRGAASEVIQLYSTASGGGDYTVTSTEPSVSRTSTPYTGGEAPTQTETTYLQSGGHNHGIIPGTYLATHRLSPYNPDYFVQWAASGAHSHLIILQSHTHDVTIPSHYHSLTLPYHSHSINMPSHRHEIEYGMYESTYATGVRIMVNGVYRGSTYYSSQNSVDLTPYIQTAGYHTIELTSNQLGRINANIFIKYFLGS